MGAQLQMTSYHQLLATLKKGHIYWIQGDWPWPLSDGRGHFFIVMNNDPTAESVLVLTHGSRQKDSARYYVALNEEDIRTLVDIDAGKYEIWKEDTVINCNDVKDVTLVKLAEIMDKHDLKISSVELDEEDFNKIVEGVLLSNAVAPVFKAPLRS